MYSHMLIGLECMFRKTPVWTCKTWCALKEGNGNKTGGPFAFSSFNSGNRSPLKPPSSAVVVSTPPPVPYTCFFFSCRFYIESISYLKDNATIELFFLNAKSCIYKVGLCSSHSLSEGNRKYRNVSHKSVLLIRKSHV